MTPAKIIDASAIAAVLFGETEGESLRHVLGDAQLIAPTLLPFELANVCLKKIRKEPGRRDQFLRALGRFDRLGVRLIAVEPEPMIRLAETVGLTAYDASYLWLAQSLSCELVTLDKRLAAAYRVSPSTP